MAEIGQFMFCNVSSIVVYLLKSFFIFVTGIKSGATVTQLTIKVYKSITYLVSPVCHYSRQRKALFWFLENKMSKNTHISRSYPW
jgi:hypothetical protein